MSNIAIIPARGGSKRITKKNIIDFFGKPMIIWTLEAAKRSKLFSRIIVSTEDELISNLVREFGFETINRPIEFSTDEATLIPVVLNVIDQLYEKEMVFDNACMLMANCPMRDENDILNSFHTFRNSSSDFLMSVFEYGMFYPFWALENTREGLKPYFGKKYIQTRSQDLPNVYCPSGAIRWVNIKKFQIEQDFYSDNLQPYILPWYKAIDIDDYKDLELARMVYSYFHLNA